MGDGNGWVRCSLGHRHWGRFGAAGLLVADDARVLLQLRAPWTHEGSTWAVPGGARDSHESAFEAAAREVTEETTLDVSALRVTGEWIDDHGGWSYTTLVAVFGEGTPASARLVAPANGESTATDWWPVDAVAQLPLHRGFAAAWPALAPLLTAGP